ncbi:hypothetical protein Mapa_009778 [Marchantia paleacea]|nr:hypothetical protein Mapa_009778 [Marchantia paleacea]
MEETSQISRSTSLPSPLPIFISVPPQDQDCAPCLRAEPGAESFGNGHGVALVQFLDVLGAKNLLALAVGLQHELGLADHGQRDIVHLERGQHGLEHLLHRARLGAAVQERRAEDAVLLEAEGAQRVLGLALGLGVEEEGVAVGAHARHQLQVLDLRLLGQAPEAEHAVVVDLAEGLGRPRVLLRGAQAAEGHVVLRRRQLRRLPLVHLNQIAHRLVVQLLQQRLRRLHLLGELDLAPADHRHGRELLIPHRLRHHVLADRPSPPHHQRRPPSAPRHQSPNRISAASRLSRIC